MALLDRRTGEVKVAQVFVAALGASHYTYVASLTQTRWRTGSAAMSERPSTSGPCLARSFRTTSRAALAASVDVSLILTPVIKTSPNGFNGLEAG